MRSEQIGANCVESRSTKSTSRSRHVAIMLGPIVGLLAWMILEWVAVQPARHETEKISSELQAVRDENNRTETMIANYETFRIEAERVEAEYAEALSAVPSEAELAAALSDVERITGASGVRLVAFEPAKSTSTPPPPKPSNASASNELPAPVEARPVSVILHSRYEPTQSLLERLAKYPRLLTVEAFSLRSLNTGAYTTEASLTLNCYYKVAPSIATPSTLGH